MLGDGWWVMEWLGTPQSIMATSMGFSEIEWTETTIAMMWILTSILTFADDAAGDILTNYVKLSRPFAKWEHLKAVLSKQTSIWSERSGKMDILSLSKKSENEPLTWELLWTWQQCQDSQFPGTRLSENVAREADLGGSKKGEFVILGAKKDHHSSLRFAMKNLKIHIHDRGEKSWPGGPFMRKCVQISSDEGYITSSPYTAIERGRRQHLKQTTSAPWMIPF